MSQDNPFAGVGSVIKGRRFIGREDEVRRIREKLLDQEDFTSVAITGMPRIGKSSLAHHALSQKQNDKQTSNPIVITRVDVSIFTSSNDFFDGIVRRMEAALEDLHLLDQELSSNAKRVLETDDEGAKFFEIERVFRKLNRADIRAICVLDEFDSIRSIFHGKPQCFKFLRELASGGDCKTGFLLLSKRPLSDISTLAGIDPKYWKNVLEEYSLTGFNGSALDLYFERLNEAGIKCEADIRSEVLALCGPHPFLLDWFAYEAFRLNSTSKQLDKKVCSTILAPAILELCKLVREVLEDSRWIGKLTQMLIGPRVDVTNEDINSLVKYGVLVRDRKGQLQPFVPAFTNLLKNERVAPIKPASALSSNLPATQQANQVSEVISQQNSKISTNRSAENSLCREGSFWRFSFEKKACVVPHSDGVVYIARLLESQPHPLTIAELRGAVGKSDVASLMKADDIGDSKTHSAIQKRINQLQDAQAIAEETGDNASAADVTEELERLVRANRQQTFRGKPKKLGDPDKALTNAIGNAISNAIKLLKDSKHHPELARHLSSHILRRYSPNPCYAPSTKVAWKIVR